MIKILTDASAEAILRQVKETEGSLSDLSTAAKGNLVSAVNEVKNDAATLDSRTKVFAEARALGNAGFAHNLIYRGKSLGTKPSAAQLAAIANGTFDDMYLGDYWTGAGNEGWTDLCWMIVHFNYYAADWGGAYLTTNNNWTDMLKARGFTTTHYAPHLTVMQMKSATASTAKGLPRFTSAPSSDLTDEAGQLVDWYNNALIPTFGDEHVIPTLCYLREVNAQGLPTGGGWMDFRRVFIPYYSQITGIVFPCSDGTIRRTGYEASTSSRFSTNEKQFAAFQVAGFMLNDFGTKTAHGDFWLRDLVGPNGSGTPMGLFIQNDDYIGRVRPYNYTTANSTFHVYATIA